MAESYAVLHGKYQRALVTIRELTQEKERSEKQLVNLKEQHVQIEKSAKYLCETILKKDRVAKDEKTWFRMELKDMIDAAQASIESYFPSIEGLMQKMLDACSERTDKIAALEKKAADDAKAHEKELADLTRMKDDVIAKLSEKLKTGRIDEEEISKIVKETEKANVEDVDIALGGVVTVSPEDDDGIDDAVAQSVETMYEAGELVVPAKPGPRVEKSKKAREKAKAAVEKIAEKQGDEIAKVAKGLSDPQRLLLRVMGETGLVEMGPILAAAKKEYPELKSESSLKASMHGLMSDTEDTKPLVSSTKLSVPASNNFCVYELTKEGKETYEWAFGKPPVEAETDAIRKAHTTLEHGYGIRNTAQLIETAPFVEKLGAKVEWLTRSKEHTVKTGPNSAYIPDIVIRWEKDGKPQKQYVEYETGKCADGDFFAKCSKIASFSRYVNVIVPKNEAKDETIRKVEKWRDLITKEGGKFPNQDRIVVRISTYYELKDAIKDGQAKSALPWAWEKTISKPKDRK